MVTDRLFLEPLWMVKGSVALVTAHQTGSMPDLLKAGDDRIKVIKGSSQKKMFSFTRYKKILESNLEGKTENEKRFFEEKIFEVGGLIYSGAGAALTVSVNAVPSFAESLSNAGAAGLVKVLTV